MSFKIRVNLRSIEEIDPFGSGPDNWSLHWYGLSDCYFCITIGEAEIFKFSDEFVKAYSENESPVNKPYVDYYLARLHEDLLEILPDILEPVPEELVPYIANPQQYSRLREMLVQWLEQESETAESKILDIHQLASNWSGQRCMSFGYLNYAPVLYIWRTGDEIHIRWNNQDKTYAGVAVWSALEGKYTLDVSEFLEAITEFNREFMEAMLERINQVRQHWSRPEIQIDPNELEKEQAQREELLTQALERKLATDWSDVLEALKVIEAFTKGE
jgi:hypothetical protein